jgi:chemotaxis protein histidine kinase CheA
MNSKFGVFTLLSIILLSTIGSYTFIAAFADDDDNSNRDQQRTEEEQKRIEEKKIENEKKAEEKRAELEEKRKELEEKRQELAKKRAELEEKREKLEEKFSERAEKYESKLEEIKEKYKEQIEEFESKKSEFSLKSKEIEDEIEEKSEKIQERLEAKSKQLDSRTQKILEKINDDEYMGEKIGSIVNTDKYELVFDNVTAFAVSDKSTTSTMTGKMTFTTFDSKKSNLKLELESCDITVDEIPYVCGFGKARSVASGESGAKDSLVIIAFLEDNLAEEVHSTLKIFLNSDIPINQIDSSQVSILGPQSKLSHLWFLNGNATLGKIVTDVPDSTDTSDEDGNDLSITLEETISMEDKP